jgi:hypothetical protein
MLEKVYSEKNNAFFDFGWNMEEIEEDFGF